MSPTKLHNGDYWKPNEVDFDADRWIGDRSQTRTYGEEYPRDVGEMPDEDPKNSDPNSQTLVEIPKSHPDPKSTCMLCHRAYGEDIYSFENGG